ncbi:MAG: hypothetical protein U0802_25230 [Candidatus Binatia bacterium]
MGRALLAMAALVMALGSLPAQGADVTLRFGRIAKLRDKDGTGSDQVIVKFVKESGLTTAVPGPLCPATSSIGLTTDTQDLLIVLDCAFWSAAGSSGFRYDDPTGSRGGVTQVKVASKITGGKLLIKLKGDQYGTNSISGPIGSLEVSLTTSGVSYCGRFAPPQSAFIKSRGRARSSSRSPSALVHRAADANRATASPLPPQRPRPRSRRRRRSPAPPPSPAPRPETPTTTETPTPSATPTVLPRQPDSGAGRLPPTSTRSPCAIRTPFIATFAAPRCDRPAGRARHLSQRHHGDADHHRWQHGRLPRPDLVALLRPLARPPAARRPSRSARRPRCTFPARRGGLQPRRQPGAVDRLRQPERRRLPRSAAAPAPTTAARIRPPSRRPPAPPSPHRR